jgi:SAM-dependent methyltransferase
MRNSNTSKLLRSKDWNKAHWGNNEAAICFLNQTGLIQSPQKIIEIGCGKGYILSYLVKKGHNAIGIDNNPAAIEQCNKDLNIQEADANSLPFKDDIFDIALSFDVIEHIPETDFHLKEVRRVLKTGGHYLLQTPNKWTNIPFEMLRFSRAHGIRNTFDFLKPPEHCALHNYWQLKKRFQEHDFEVEFFDIPVVNDFFKEKLKTFLGNFGLVLLQIINPDKFPIFLRTNFFLRSKLKH